MNDLRDDEFRGTDRFAVQHRLGSGGMGVVYLAYDRQRAELVAVKTLRYVDPQAIYRLKREFRAMSQLTHPHLVSLHELFCVDQQWFFTMEYIDGVNLLEYLRARPGTGRQAGDLADMDRTTHGTPPGTRACSSASWNAGGEAAESDDDDFLPPPPCSAPGSAVSRVITPEQLVPIRHVLAQLAEGVCRLHAAGKLHRDLKPTNVLVGQDARVVVLDFGLSTEMAHDARSSTTEGFLVGTVPYMSPEQAAGKALTPASDWYSFGVILYETLTGRTPFIGRPLQMLTDKQRLDPPPPATVVHGVPADLDTLCVQLLSRDPRSRPGGPEVLRRIGGRTGAALPARSPEMTHAPFIGRQQSLAVLHSALAQVRRGRTVVVCVAGESGVGKSALVRNFLDGVREDLDMVALSGRCYDCESIPYKGLDGLVDALSHYLVRLSRLEVEAVMPRDVAPLLRVFPVLRRVEALAAGLPRGPGPVDKQELRDRAFSGLRELFGRLGDRSTLVLHIDDLQWCDADSAQLLGELVRPPDAPALLLVVCQRTAVGFSEQTAGSDVFAVDAATQPVDVRHVPLEPLNAEDSRQLALALWDAPAAAPESLIESVATSAAGNPYFLESLVRHHRNALPVRSRRRAPNLHTLEYVLLDQCASLNSSAQKLLQVVSVAGHPLRFADACRAAALTEDASAALAALRAAGLIRAPGTSDSLYLEVYHDRIRETVVAQLEPAERIDINRSLAEAMEHDGRSDPATLAAHFVAGKEVDKARAYYLKAANQASDALAFERAAELYRQACEIGISDAAQLRSLTCKRAAALANAGRGDEAGQQYEAAAAGAPADEALELSRLAAMQYLFSGNVGRGTRLLRSVLANIGLRLPAGPRRALLEWLRLRAVLRMRGLRFKQVDSSAVDPNLLKRIDICWSATAGLSTIDPISSAVFQTRGLLLALKSGEPNRIARALCVEAAHVSVLGGSQRDHVESLLEMAETTACRLDNPHVQGLIQLASGIAALSQGRWQAARRACDRAEEVFRQRCTGVAWEIDCASAGAATALFDAGEVTELARRLPPLRERARKRGNLFALTGPSSMNLPAWAADQPEAAEQVLDACMRHWPDERFYVQHFSALYDQIQTDLYRGDPATAWTRIAKHKRSVIGSLLMRVQLSRVYTYQTRARCALALAECAKDPRRLLRRAERDARLVQREGEAWSLPLAELVLAAVAAARRQVTEAIELLEKAVVHFDKVDMVLYAAVARRRLGELLGDRAGEDLVTTADRWMAEQNVVNTSRFVQMFAPGFAVGRPNGSGALNTRVNAQHVHDK